MGFTATFVHMLLWNFDDIKYAWQWATPAQLKARFGNGGWRFWKNQETAEERNHRRQNGKTQKVSCASTLLIVSTADFL